MDLRAVETLAMLEEIVLSQSFAMIACDHDQRLAEHAATAQIINNRPICSSRYARQLS